MQSNVPGDPAVDLRNPRADRARPGDESTQVAWEALRVAVALMNVETQLLTRVEIRVRPHTHQNRHAWSIPPSRSTGINPRRSLPHKASARDASSHTVASRDRQARCGGARSAILRSMNGRLTALGVRIYGAPPGPGAPREERLRWIRRFYVRPAPFNLLIFVAAAIVVPQWWVWALLGLLAVMWLSGVTRLTREIRREHRSHDERATGA